MTKKDYVLIAAVIKKNPAVIRELDFMTDLILALQGDNPGFDTAAFAKACRT